MDVFFDTEFSGFENARGYRYLISIGCVSQCGREFYAELSDTWDEHLCSFFVLENVLPLLEGGACRMSVSDLSINLNAWIESLGGNEIIFKTDAPAFDWPFVEEIFKFHGWPNRLHRKCGTICFETPL